MRLIVSSGTHLLTNTETRIEEIKEQLDHLDIIFVEDREENKPTREKLLNWVWNPLILIPLNIWLFSLVRLGRIIPSDQEIINELEDQNIEQIPVDKPIHDIFSDQRKTWGAANWSMISLPIVLIVSSPNLIIILFSVVLLIIASIGLFFAFLAGSHSERDIHMVLKMREFAKEDGVDQACLIVGKQHKSGIRDFCKQFDNIEIVD